MSDGLPDRSSRLDALEARIAHQDQTLAELNEVITSQWRRIDILERQMAQLREEFHDLGAARGAPEPPPPHY
jgi:SlyX protein